ncbi:MAG: hypothetical protein U0736_12760 [Gemmataceae bacterium]
MDFSPIPEIVDGLPNLCGHDAQVEAVTARQGPVYLHETNLRFDRLQAVACIALHMQQPLIPAGGGDMRTAETISNLQAMVNASDGDRYNAGIFADCYGRIGDIVADLVHQGKNPRVMLDYSGELFYGLRKMGRGDVLERLRRITTDSHLRRHVEWLGTMWGHAVASSTPLPDLKLHMRAWQHHFAAVYGWDALGRVRGFSPPEMHLPNHPDAAYEYVKALTECGYQWLLVQEHTVEGLDGKGLSDKHLPHRLVAKNSAGEEASILALIKTQGSDTKLVAQMQPFYEARGQQPRTIGGVRTTHRHADRRWRERRGDDERIPGRLPQCRVSGRHRGCHPGKRHRVPGDGRGGRCDAGDAAGLPADSPGAAVRADHALGAGRRRQGAGRPPPRAAGVLARRRVVDQQHQLGEGLRQPAVRHGPIKRCLPSHPRRPPDRPKQPGLPQCPLPPPNVRN